MRLIDGAMQAGLLTEYILERKNKIVDILQKGDNDLLFAIMIDYFDCQPTVYDVDKVIEIIREGGVE